MSSWLFLVLSGVLESVWAIALSKSQGFTRAVPTAVFVVALVASMSGLAYALKQLPVGTAYAVWVGIGAALAVAYGMAQGIESYSHTKALLLVTIVAAVVGLKLQS